MSSADSSDPREQQFDDIVADYLDAVEAGRDPEEDRLLREYPSLADSLQNFFADHRRMRGAVSAPPAEHPSGDHPVRDVARAHYSTAGRHGDSTHEPTIDFGHRKTPASSGAADAPTVARSHELTSPTDLGSGIRSGDRILGDYQLLDKIAQGGMGVVYRARQLSLGRVVALKMIRAGELADDEEVRRFRAEAEAAAQLDHPGIVPIYQVGVEQGTHYFSMALVEGRSLAEMIREQPLAPLRAAEYMVKVSRAVQYAHERGIIHRDLKPANVLVDRNDEPKVTDFGLAKRVHADEGMTVTGQILGTASYMPPEQASGKLDRISPRSDIYSLGAVLYTLTTGRPPFVGDNPIEILLDVLSDEVVPPRTLHNKIPKDLETVTLKCLQKDPSRRYGSANELAEDLTRILEGRPILARRTSPVEHAWRWCRRKPAVATALVLALALAVTVPLFLSQGWSLQGTVDYAISWIGLRDDAGTSAEQRLIDSALAHCQTLVIAEADEPQPNSRQPADVPDHLAVSLATRVMLEYHRVGWNGAQSEVRLESLFDHCLVLSQELEQRVAHVPPDPRYLVALADCHLNLGDLTLRRMRSRSPGKMHSADTLGTAKEHFVRAESLLHQLEAAYSDNELLQTKLAAAKFGLVEASLAQDAKAQLREAAQATGAFSEEAKRAVWQRGVISFSPTDLPFDRDTLLASGSDDVSPSLLGTEPQLTSGEDAHAPNVHKPFDASRTLAMDVLRDTPHNAQLYYEAVGALTTAIRKSLNQSPPDPAEIRRDYALLAALCQEGRAYFNQLEFPSDIWPRDPISMYQAVLAIRRILE